MLHTHVTYLKFRSDIQLIGVEYLAWFRLHMVVLRADF